MAEALPSTQGGSRFRLLKLTKSVNVEKEEHNKENDNLADTLTLQEELPSDKCSTRLRLLALANGRRLETTNELKKQSTEKESAEYVVKLHIEKPTSHLRTFKQLLAIRRREMAILEQQKKDDLSFSDTSSVEDSHTDEHKMEILDDIIQSKEVEEINLRNEEHNNPLSDTVSRKSELECRRNLIPRVLLAKRAKPMQKPTQTKYGNEHSETDLRVCSQDTECNPDQTCSNTLDEDFSQFYFKEEDIKPVVGVPFNLAYTSETWIYDYLRPGKNSGTELIINTNDTNVLEDQTEPEVLHKVGIDEDSDELENFKCLKIDTNKLDTTEDSSEVDVTITKGEGYSIWDEIRAGLPPREPRKGKVFVMPAGGNVKAYLDRFMESNENAEKTTKKKKKKKAVF